MAIEPSKLAESSLFSSVLRVAANKIRYNLFVEGCSIFKMLTPIVKSQTRTVPSLLAEIISPPLAEYTIDWTASLWPSSFLAYSLLDNYQSRIKWSSPEDVNSSEFVGENATDRTRPKCPICLLCFRPVSTFQTRSVLSSLPETKYLPSLEKLIAFTSF